jgi:nitrate reductase gamma subunit
MTATTILVWGVWPYVALTLLVVGLVWRYRTDKFGWTTRSTEIYERRLLAVGSPLFHVGILLVGGGHVMGLLVPKGFTEATGMSEHAYHLMATVVGTGAGAFACLGLAILLYRRFVTKSVRLATTQNDLIAYCFLLYAVTLGMVATIANQVLGPEGGYDYRETIAPWLRSIVSFQPDPALMVGVPVTFQLHAFAGLLLFAVWPFTRLVHVVSAPILYPTRPYVVYRSRDAGPETRAPGRGWEPIRTQGPTGARGA